LQQGLHWLIAWVQPGGKLLGLHHDDAALLVPPVGGTALDSCSITDSINWRFLRITATAPASPMVRLAHWFMIGYIDAHRRYGGRQGCAQVGGLFNRYPRDRKAGDPVQRILSEMYDSDEADGHCIRVTIDTEDVSVKVAKIEADENGRHAEWLRGRIRFWKNA